MKHDAHDALASEFDTHRIVRQLRDVPPHEVYEVHVNGRRAVYKRDIGPTGNAATEGRVTAFIGEQTSVPVPRVLRVGDDYYVAAWHLDAPAPNEGRDIDETWAFAAGRGMATLHNETGQFIDQYGQFRLQNDGIPTAEHDDWYAAALAYVRRHRSVPDQHGHADIVDAVLEFLTERSDLFEEAGDPVCCHGWATPEHVTVRDDRVRCIVDFEHTIAAPGEFDYWRTALPTFSQDTNELKGVFRDGYESIRSLPASFARRRPLYVLLNSIYYFESLYVQDQHGPEKKAERAEWFRDSISETLESLS